MLCEISNTLSDIQQNLPWNPNTKFLWAYNITGNEK